MARLTTDQWARVRADYEVKGKSFGQLAKEYEVSKMAISKKASLEGWEQGKSLHLVEKKTKAIIDIHNVENESLHLSLHHQEAFAEAVNEQLETLANIQSANALRSRIYKAASHYALKKTLEAIQLDDSDALSDSMKLLTVGNTAILPVQKTLEKQQQAIPGDTANNSITVEFIDESQVKQ